MDTKDTPDPLAPGFALLKQELAGHDTPRCVEKELMQAFQRQFPRRRPWYGFLTLPQWGAAGALCSLTVVAVLLALSPHQSIEVSGQPPAAIDGIDGGAAFIALDSLERIEAEPDARLVEADVPRTALAALGVPLSPDNAADTVRAEMLVAIDGQPLAVRLISLN